jgi:hypothetical protein
MLASSAAQAASSASKRTKMEEAVVPLTREQCVDGENADAKKAKLHRAVKLYGSELRVHTSLAGSEIAGEFDPVSGVVSVDVSSGASYVSASINAYGLFGRMELDVKKKPGFARAVTSAIKLDRVQSVAGDSSSPTSIYCNADELPMSQLDHYHRILDRTRREFKNACFYAPVVVVKATDPTDRTSTTEYALSIAFSSNNRLTAKFRSLETDNVTGSFDISATEIADTITKTLNSSNDEKLDDAFMSFTGTAKPPGKERLWYAHTHGRGVFALHLLLPKDCFTDTKDIYVECFKFNVLQN